MNSTEFMQQFIDAWGRMDVDTIVDSFTDDAVYINIPMDPPNRGKEEIRAFVDGFAGSCEGIEFIVHNEVVSQDGTLIMNERTDRLCMNGKWIELAVMGVFEMREGKICAWRDYFDMAAFNA
ncbi:MAG: limonene-1,2-epoxide hydrolase family protein [Pseudomonadales bacterium]